jgi:hypothetical protein
MIYFHHASEHSTCSGASASAVVGLCFAHGSYWPNNVVCRGVSVVAFEALSESDRVAPQWTKHVKRRATATWSTSLQ